APNKRNKITPYELWTKRKPNLNYLRVWGCRAVSKAFRFFVIEPNESVLINSIIESKDAIFYENIFSSIPRPSLRIPIGAKDIGVLIVPEEVTKEDDKKIFDEAMKSQDVAFGKEAINDEMDPIMDVKTTSLNGELDEEVYMNQPQGFIMPGNKNKVCKLIKSLYGLKQAPKQWHQKFDEVVLSSGYLLNQADKCVYSKFYESGKGVIICLYVDDMLIFGTNHVQVDLTKEFLSSRFFMKDMEEANVIFGIRIKHESNGIEISQSHNIDKVLKKFSYFDCTPVSTPMNTSKKLMPNNSQVVSQLEYSRVIGCPMYAMNCTRPDIAFEAGKLSRYTSNPSTQHCNTKDSSSTSGSVFQLGGGVIFWASKKQTCITGSTMESEFAALAAVGKKVEWLRNLIIEIPL
nr:zinc finger, CCHC-type [Tanacetum cinerariifolium]